MYARGGAFSSARRASFIGAAETGFELFFAFYSRLGPIQRGMSPQKTRTYWAMDTRELVAEGTSGVFRTGGAVELEAWMHVTLIEVRKR